jgi:imidazolonepropionase-like amidohydrolase
MEVVKMFVLSNAVLIDGTGREAVKKAAVLVEGNRITDAGTQVSYPKTAKVVDLKGLVIMPGLMDLHVHCGGIVHLKEGEPHFVDMKASNKYADTRELSIANGVTTTRSAGDFYPDIVQVRDEINSGKLYGPRLFVCGKQFQATGGHPGFTIMEGNEYVLRNAIILVDDPKKAREGVREMVDGGVDIIKVQRGSLDPWNWPKRVPQLSLPALEALTDEAHKHNLRVMVHAETPQYTYEAVERGVDCVEHVIAAGALSTEVPDGLIKLMLDHGTYAVMTIIATLKVSSYYKGWDKLPDLMAITKQFYDAGVNIATGTDAGAPEVQFGEAVHEEMGLMVKLGMSPMDVIVASTKTAAEALGKANELGTIEKGKQADMIVVSGNPTNNIADCKNIKLVIKDGNILVDKLGLPKI